MLFLFSYAHCGNIGFPIGGGSRIIDVILDSIKEMGGDIYVQNHVTKIIIEKDKAIGIELENGKKVNGDIIISAADGMYTINTLLMNKYMSENHKIFYENPVQALSAIETNICIKGDGKEFIPSIFGTYIIFNTPLQLTYEQYEYMIMYTNNFDHSHNKSGYVTTFTMISNYDFWASMNKEIYNNEKTKIKNFILEYLKEKYPDVINNIEYIDIATPLTFHRYSNNYKGSLQGWLSSNDKWNRYIPKNFNDLENFYMCGQWTESLGGVPIASQTGKNVIQLICKDNKIPFRVK